MNQLKQPKGTREDQIDRDASNGVRSALMARVRQRGTAAEIVVRALLKAQNVRYRANAKHLPGRPDIYVSAGRVALFVHGCFWHRHANCPASSTPKTNAPFWNQKFYENVARDRRKSRALRRLGYRVFTVWECQTRDNRKVIRLAARLERIFAEPSGNAKKKKP